MQGLSLQRGYYWWVTRLLLTAIALGLASLDITGALAAVGALAAGARTRALLAFGGFTILGTVAFGTALSLIVGPRISGLDWGHLLPHDPTEDLVAALVEVVLGVGLLIWGIVRALKPGTRPPKPRALRGLGVISLAGAGILFALAAIADPTFVSLVVIAGRADRFWSVAAAHSAWTFVSHVPLVLVLAFALTGENERVVTTVRTLWAKVSPWMVRLVTVFVLLVALLLLLDAFWYFITGDLFLPS
jgi:hypothetical protein